MERCFVIKKYGKGVCKRACLACTADKARGRFPSMATKELLDALAKTSPPNGETWHTFLYKWCAKYCVFRNSVRDGQRAPAKMSDLPLLKYMRRNVMIRQVYVDGKDVKFDVVNSLAVRSVETYTGNATKFSVPVDSVFSTAYASTIDREGVVFVAGAFMVPGTVVLVDNLQWKKETPEKSKMAGVGGIAHAPPPNYRIVGVVSHNVAAPLGDSKTVVVTVFVRGEHFVSEPYDVTVPIMGHDTFYAASNSDDNKVVNEALTTAYENLIGLGSVNQALIRVDTVNQVFVGVTVAQGRRMVEFFDADVKSVFSGPKGKEYAKALNAPMLHTYAALKDFGVKQLNAAISSLSKAHDTPKDLRQAAAEMKALLFPKAATPIEPPGGGAKPGSRTSTTDAAKITQLEANLVRVRTELDKKTKAVDQSQRSRDAERAESERTLSTVTQERDVALGKLRASEIAVQKQTKLASERNMEVERLWGELDTSERVLRETREAGGATESVLAENRDLKGLVETLRGDLRTVNAENASLMQDLNTALARPSTGRRRVELPRTVKKAPTRKMYEMREEIGVLAKAIVMLKDLLRRNPADAKVATMLHQKERERDEKSHALFALMR